MNGDRPNAQVKPDPELAIEVQGLSKSFGALKAVDGLSFKVKKGEVFGILGPNGSGKTTTIRMLCGILQPSSGSGRALGFDVLRESEAIKSHIGYMSQKFSLYDDLTVLENLRFYAGVQAIPRARRKERVQQMLELAGLENRREQLTAYLSGGWKQRLALSCALVHEPRMIFLDEPTAGVDPVSRRRFWDMIYQISDAGATFLVTTHYMDEAELFNHLLFMSRGRLIAEGAPETIKKESFQNDLWQVTCNKLAQAAYLLQDRSEVVDVSLPGNALHVTTGKSIPAQEMIQKTLQEAGITVYSVTKTRPSLEDVFVSLTTNDTNNGAGDNPPDA